MEWTQLPRLSRKAGKGTITVDSSRNPPTIVIKDGDTTYKGIYRFVLRNSLELYLSKPGDDFPKGFGDSPLFGVPNGFKGVAILCDPKRK